MIYTIKKIKDTDWQTEAENVESTTPIYSEEINNKVYAKDILDNIINDLKTYNIELDFDDWDELENSVVINCYFYAPKELDEDQVKEILTDVIKSYKGDWDDLKFQGDIEDNSDKLYLVDLYIYTKYFDK